MPCSLPVLPSTGGWHIAGSSWPLPAWGAGWQANSAMGVPHSWSSAESFPGGAAHCHRTHAFLMFCRVNAHCPFLEVEPWEVLLSTCLTEAHQGFPGLQERAQACLRIWVFTASKDQAGVGFLEACHSRAHGHPAHLPRQPGGSQGCMHISCYPLHLPYSGTVRTTHEVNQEDVCNSAISQLQNQGWNTPSDIISKERSQTACSA